MSDQTLEHLEELTNIEMQADLQRLDGLVVDAAAPDVIVLDEPPEPLGRPFLKLWLATAISNLGDGARLTALPLLAATITREPLAISGLLFAGKLPWLLLSLHSGAIADRVDRRKLIAGVTIGRGIVMALLAFAAIAGNVTLPMIYAVALIQGIGEVFADNASFALLPSLVPRSRLEDANGRLESAVIVANEFAGPALGGLLFAVAIALPFSLDAVSFLGAALLIATLPKSPSLRVTEQHTTIRTDIAEGLRWMWHNSTLRDLSLIACATNLVLFATFSIQVLFVLEVLGLSAQGFGIFLAVEALGAVGGSLIAAKLRKRWGVARTVALALATAAVANLMLAMTTAWVFAGAMAMLVSVGGGVWNVVTNSFRQQATPDELLGRVQSSHRLLSWGAMPIGTLLGGAVSAAFGLHAPFLVAGLVLTALAFLVAAVLGRSNVPATVPSGA